MLKINLLPENERKTTLSPVEQLHRTPLMWIAVVVMVAMPLAFLVPIHIRRQQLQQLNARIQLLEPRWTEVAQIQRYLLELRAQEAAFRELGRGQGLWSKRFNALSDVTPERVWFSELILDQTKGLMIQGSAIGQDDPEMGSVNRLVKGLKADPGFLSVMKDVQIESINRVQDGEVEVVQFTLTCPLRDTATPAGAP